MQHWKPYVHQRAAGVAVLAIAVSSLLPGLGLPAAIAQQPLAAVALANATIAQELLQLVNAERRRVNAPPLTLSDKLLTAAQRHAQDMATSRRMSHTGSNGSSMRSRIDATEYSWSTIGENVAVGQPTAAAVMSAWMSSPGHRQNILNPAFTELGIGYASAQGRIYWAQVFGRPL
ncbi:MAG: CAP domain-containing protein [Nodosilinea sp.]